jgi:hypothetical protein
LIKGTNIYIFYHILIKNNYIFNDPRNPKQTGGSKHEYKNIKNRFINILLTYLHGRSHPNLHIQFPKSAVLAIISYDDIDFILREKHKPRSKSTQIEGFKY